MNQSNEINELATALAKAQSEMRPVIKDSTNPFYNSKYADLSSVWEACRDPLSKNGLSVIQTTQCDCDREMTLITTLAHSSGQWIKSHTPVYIPKEGVVELDKWGKPKKPNRLHQIGSALTYLRRYALSCIIGISSDEDDDANCLTENSVKNRKESEDSRGVKHDTKSKKSQSVISKQECERLKEIFPLCDSEYSAKLTSYLNSMGIKDFESIPEDLYKRILTGMEKNSESYQKLIVGDSNH